MCIKLNQAANSYKTQLFQMLEIVAKALILLSFQTYTDDEFISKAAGFNAWCKDNDLVPLIEVFAIYMGVTRSCLDEWRKIEAREDIIKRVDEAAVAGVLSGGLKGIYRDAMSIFYAKNKGYSDKQELAIDGNITISIPGLDSLTK